MARSPDYPYRAGLDEIVGELRREHIMPETGWMKVGPSEPHDVDFENGWGNAGVVADMTNAPTSWYLSEDGEVRLRGKIDGGAVETVVFVLPEEVRPEYAETFICAVDGGGKANVTIHANGEVVVDSITT